MYDVDRMRSLTKLSVIGIQTFAYAIFKTSIANGTDVHNSPLNTETADDVERKIRNWISV
jgi:hypothetical protein